MRRLLYLIVPLFFISSGMSATAELSDELMILRPMVGKKWVGKIKALDGSGYLDLVREYEVILDGKAIRISNYCQELDNYNEGLIYWDASEGRIRLTTINNKGTSQNGYVSEEDGKILFHGTISFTSRSLEFRNYFEFPEEGKMVDKWYRYEDDQWQAGHSVELTVAED